MLENDFSTANRSPKEDSSQINEHLDNMSIDELTDALTDMWDATDDLTYSAAWMDECLKKIDQIEDAPEFDVDASLNNFLAHLKTAAPKPLDGSPLLLPLLLS